MSTVDPQIVSLVEDHLGAIRARKVGRELIFSCPVHDDKNPSARYNPESHVWWCHCGAKGGVIDLAQRFGLELPKMGSPGVWSEEAIYRYVDERGVELFQVVRVRDHETGKKKFWQRHSYDAVERGWKYDLTGVRRVLYNLPEVLAAHRDTPIFVVEGEKDVERLRSLGLVATCNPGGALKWREEYAKVFDGRPVVVIPDNDKDGKTHGEQVVASIATVAASATLADLPGLPDKGDVSDWLDLGHTADDLLALVAAPEREYRHVYDILASPAKDEAVLPTGYRDLDIVLDGGLRPGQVFILAARPGVGKSSFAAGVAYHVAASGRNVGFYTLEMSAEQIASRIGNYGSVSYEENVFVDDRASLSIIDLGDRVRRMHERESISLVVVDYIQLMQGRGGNRVQDVSDISRGLKLIAKELGVPVLALSQLNREVEHRDGKRRKFKLSDLRESGAIEQDADIVAFLDREELYAEDGLRGIATLDIQKHREGPLAELPFGFYGVSALLYDLSLAG